MAFEFQAEGIEFLRSQPRALLGDEPGLGKTRQLLMAAEGPTLVVAPAMILDSGTWDNEITKWRPDLDVTAVSYHSLCAREKTGKYGSRPLPEIAPEYDREWGTVILDEAHYVKGRKTTWTQAVKKLRTDRLYQATGTPIPNWAHELFVLLQLLRPDEAKPGGYLGSYWRWVAQWFAVMQSPFDAHARDIGDLLPHHTWADFHTENLGGLFLQRLRDDVLTDLPPMTRVPWKVKMGREQRRVYNEIKRDFIAWTESGSEVVAWNKSALTVKLAKLATGVEVEDPDSRGSAKLDALRDILRDRQQPTLVVAHFRATARECERAAIDAGMRTVYVDGGTSRPQRRRAVAEFQAGEADVFVGTVDTISEGITLTAADCAILVERSWRPSRNEQVIRRIHRIGQERPVTVIDLITERTVDERILKVLEEKTDQQVAALRPADIAALA